MHARRPRPAIGCGSTASTAGSTTRRVSGLRREPARSRRRLARAGPAPARRPVLAGAGAPGPGRSASGLAAGPAARRARVLSRAGAGRRPRRDRRADRRRWARPGSTRCRSSRRASRTRSARRWCAICSPRRARRWCSTPPALPSRAPARGARRPSIEPIAASCSWCSRGRQRGGLASRAPAASSARDLAMNVGAARDRRPGARPARSRSRRSKRFDAATESHIVGFAPVADRSGSRPTLAAAWARLGATPVAERRIALVLANYPTRDGRIANGVGLDTPASTVRLLRRAARRRATGSTGCPADGQDLIARLLGGVSNDLATRRTRRRSSTPDAARLPDVLSSTIRC